MILKGTSPEELKTAVKYLKEPHLLYSVFDFGYCPKCNDITRIDFFSSGDEIEDPLWRSRVKCLKCETVYSSNPNFPPSIRDIKFTGCDIPPKFKRKWNYRRTKKHQRHLLKKLIRGLIKKNRRRIKETRSECEKRIKQLEKISSQLEYL